MARRRSPANAMKRLFDDAPNPVYVVDRSGRILYCNPACATWLGLEANSLIGERCCYDTSAGDGGIRQVANGLSPPPEALLGESCEAVITSARESGPLLQRLAMFSPLGNCADDCVGCVAVVQGEDMSADDIGQSQMISESARLHSLLAAVRHEMGARYSVDRLIGVSPAIRRVRSQIQLAVQSKSRVLVVGPPGSGREHVARTIYYHGVDESGGALVPLSCSLLDAELLQTTISEFVEQFPERIELKQPAALMLLDVDDLSHEAQTALMAALDIVELHLRTISTARRPLFELVSAGAFREDLAHALSTLVLDLPPLCERREDIPLLAQAVLEEGNRERTQPLSGLSTETTDRLSLYPFHGNMDELHALITEACERATGPFVAATDLPDQVEQADSVEAHPRRADDPIELDEALADVECELIKRALAKGKGNRAQAARLLGVSRPRLLRRIEHFGLE